MIWIAEMTDGVVDQLTSRVTATSLDRSKVKRFRITESAGATSMQFNATTGRVNFSCMDYTKLCGLEEAELTMKWNKEFECFEMDAESLAVVQALKLDSEDHFFFIEFEGGRWNIYNQEFQAGYLLDGVDIPFNTAPYDFIYEIEHNEDFHMSTNGPVRKVSYDTAYQITTKAVHKHEDIEFNLEQTVRYDVLKGHVIYELLISANKEINGQLYTSLQGMKTMSLVQLDRGTKSKRTTLMVV